MDIETAKYILNFYHNLLPQEIKLAVHHTRSLFFCEEKEGMYSVAQIYRKYKWISNEDDEIDLIKDGEEVFLINVAERIMKENSDEIFLNYCPKCNGLARTPLAKQCRFCGHDWH